MELVELTLISTSVEAGEPADCDLVFRLEEAQDLPDFSQVHPWAGKTISSLRDRSMIEWLFTHISAQSHFRSMTGDIDAVIKKRGSKTEHHQKPSRRTKERKCDSEEREGEGEVEFEPLRKVRVGVSCSNGAQVGPCFVEKLFKHYETSTRWDNLAVKRYHWDALGGSWGRNKDFVWQQKTVPTRYKEDIRELIYDEMWIAFPSSVSAAVESAFLQDPFCHQFRFEEYSFNFEAGIVHNSKHKNSYLVRCNMAVSDSMVHCWFLGHQEYISSTSGYKSAGILPYSVHPASGEAVFLLGKITYGLADWCDFGGLKSFKERPRFTAARECWEETFGIIGSVHHLATVLKDFSSNNVFKVVNMETRYVSHFLRVPYQDYPAIFRSRRADEETKNKPIEVSKMRKAVQMTLVGQLRVKADAMEDGDNCGQRPRPLPMRREFMDTLCVADKLGILDSIEHIARKIHWGGREGERRGDSKQLEEKCDAASTSPDQQPEIERECRSSDSDRLDPANDLNPIAGDTTADPTSPRPHPLSEEPEDSSKDPSQQEEVKDPPIVSTPDMHTVSSEPQPQHEDKIQEKPLDPHSQINHDHQNTTTGATRTQQDVDALLPMLRAVKLKPNHPVLQPSDSGDTNKDNHTATAAMSGGNSHGTRGYDGGIPRKRAKKPNRRQDGGGRGARASGDSQDQLKKSGTKIIEYGMGAGTLGYNRWYH